MTRSQALSDIHRKLAHMDDRELACALRPLSEQDMTWNERTDELHARVVLLLADGPSQDVLDAIGAHVVSYKIALAGAEETRIESGEAA